MQLRTAGSAFARVFLRNCATFFRPVQRPAALPASLATRRSDPRQLTRKRCLTLLSNSPGQQSKAAMSAPKQPRDDDPTGPILDLDAFPPTGTPIHDKLQAWDLFKKMGEPRHIVAPMVDQSELAWRILSRRHGSHLVYTPMISSSAFLRSVQSKGHYEKELFYIKRQAEQQEEGAGSIASGSSSKDTDRPLVVQFAGNDPDTLLQAAKVVAPYCDAVDLNLGCPQSIARRGHYGAFLQSDWQLIFRLVNKLHLELEVPVTAKMRVFDSTERTIAYAKMLERAGAQIITVHGRTREMKGHNTGLADWEKIRAVKESVRVPVFSNGNVLFHEDVEASRKATLADGVMSAEGNLYNPAIFESPPTTPTPMYPSAPALAFPHIVAIATEYLDIVEGLSTPTAPSAIRAHLFRLARPALEVHRDLRPALGKTQLDPKAKNNIERYAPFRSFVAMLQKALDADEKDERYLLPSSSNGEENGKGGRVIPHWLAQPYYRAAMPPKNEDPDEALARLEKRKARIEETKGFTGDRASVTEIADKQAKDEAKILGLGEDVANHCNSAGDVAAKRLRTDLEEARLQKDKANALFERKLYEDAIVAYSTVLDSLPARSESKHTDDDEGHGERNAKRLTVGPSVVEQALDSEVARLRAVVYANIAAAHTKLERYKETVVACNHALEDDPVYLKALHRRAQANERLGTWSSLSSALEDYKVMSSLPHAPALDSSLREAMERLPAQIEEVSAAEKQEMLGKLKGIGDSVLGYFGLSTNNFQLQQGEGGGYSLNFVR